jgi:hypothetical protein
LPFYESTPKPSKLVSSPWTTGRPAKKAHVNKTAHNVNKSEQAATKTKGLNRRNAAFVAEYPKDRRTRTRRLLKKPEICAEFCQVTRAK